MAEIIWTNTAQTEFEAIVNVIAFENEIAARRVAKKIEARVARLKDFPKLGSRIPELPDSPFRQLVVPPCRIFYHTDMERVIIQYVMRSERLFLPSFLD